MQSLNTNKTSIKWVAIGGSHDSSLVARWIMTISCSALSATPYAIPFDALPSQPLTVPLLRVSSSYFLHISRSLLRGARLGACSDGACPVGAMELPGWSGGATRLERWSYPVAACPVGAMELSGWSPPGWSVGASRPVAGFGRR